jgi:biopolymer transport protein ExbD
MAIASPGGDGGDDTDDGSGGGGLFADINITPLTDVFLVLLIIFMLGALASQLDKQNDRKRTKEVVEQLEAERRSGLKVNLPSGEAQELDTSKASLGLTIPVTGDIVAGGKPVPDAELDNLLRSAYVRDKEMQVVLFVDQGVPHGRVVQIMERSKKAGLSRLIFGTK